MRISLPKTHGNGWAPAAVMGVVSAIALFTLFFRLASLCPVPYFDPAYNGLDALRILRRGVTPIFFPVNGGREPLMIYLQAASMGVLGVNTFALRLPGVVAALMGVPLLYGLGNCLFRDRGRSTARQAAVYAALTLSLSAWYVSQSRLGLRVALLPPLAVGTAWLFVSGWRAGNLRRLAAAGVLLGISAYTYTAARVLPFVIVLAALPDLVCLGSCAPVSRRRRWCGLALLAACALMVFLPLGWYYVTHRAMFADRAGSVMVWNVWRPDSGTTLAQELIWNVLRSVGWFAQLPLPLFLGLVTGAGLALARPGRLENRLLLIWWVLLLLPAILTIENPHLMRSFGAAPPTYLLVGLGWATGLNWLLERAGAARLPAAFADGAALLVGLALAVGSLPSLVAYYNPAEPDGLARISAVADRAEAEARTHPVYLPLSSYDNPSLRFALAGTFDRRAVWSVPREDGGETAPVVLIEPTNYDDPRLWVRLSPDGSITLLPPLSPGWADARQTGAEPSEPITDCHGNTVGRAVILSPFADPSLFLQPAGRTADADVPGLARLDGYRADTADRGPTFPHLTAGDALWVTTYWLAHGGAREDYDLLVYVVDDAGVRWGSADGPPLSGTYSTSLWRPGEEIADSRLMWVYPQAHAGRYWIDVAVYDNTTGRRLPVSGGSAPDTIRLGPVKLPLRPTGQPADIHPDGARFGKVATLVGHAARQEQNRLRLALVWRAEQPDGKDYTVFVHLLDQDGQVVAGQDSQPMDNSYVTGIWEPGEMVTDEHTIVTQDLAPGDYRLEIGLYALTTGQRLEVVMPDGATAPEGRLLLTEQVRIP